MNIRFTNEQLCKMISRKQDGALEQLIRQNEGFVRIMANRIYTKYAASAGLLSCHQEDMLQEGRIALMKAAETYEAEAGAGFLTYTARLVHNAMVDHIRGMAKGNLAKTAVISVAGEMTNEAAENGVSCMQGIYACCDPYRYTPEQIYLRKETLQSLKSGLANSLPRNRAYLLYRYGFEDGEEHSLKETAAHFQLNLSRAKRTEKDGIEQLKKYMHAHGE